jgi:hypothetical protein
MRDQALSRAELDAPACESADDCVSISLTVECPEVVYVRDCGFVVHREVARRYAEMGVNAAICRAVEGAATSCSVGPSCLAAAPPECHEGRCVSP